MHSIRDCMRHSTLPRLEQQMLWEHVLQVSRVWLIAHDTDSLTPEQLARYWELDQRRQHGEPMAYLVGEREFMGHRFQVNPAVLIPRPDTETLVDIALQHVQDIERPRMVDLGTGSGAIAISLALARPDAQVYATDLSEQALQVARLNAQRLCGKVEFYAGNWYDAIVGQAAFDVIVSNPPYIAQDDHHLKQGDVRYEPRSALTDEADGLSDLRAIITQAALYLRVGGYILLEHGWDQGQAVRQLLQQANYSTIHTYQDLAGNDRVTGGQFLTS